MLNEINGNLITLAKSGHFDVIAHGCNCFCAMGAGIAPDMAKAFGADKFPFEQEGFKGSYNKMGCIDAQPKIVNVNDKNQTIYVVNAYTQYSTGGRRRGEMDLDMTALRSCLRKINHYFKGKHIGLPLIGCGLAGGNWEEVKQVIEEELASDCNVTIVHYDGTRI